MNKRILIIGEYGSLNGGENSFLSVLPSLIEFGWKFQAAVPADSDFSNALQSLGLPTHDLAIADSLGVRKSQVEIRACIGAIIQRVQPAIVHSNSLSTSRLCGPITNELGVPSLGYLRDILKLSKKAISDINQTDRLIAVSQATKNWHVDQGIDSTKTSVVYNGVDSIRFAPAAETLGDQTFATIRSELGIAPDDPILLFVGQIGIRKGVDVLMESFLRLSLLNAFSKSTDEATSTSPPHLVIVGQRHSQKQEAIQYEQRLHEQCRESGLSDRIHWLGRRSDIADLMRASTILVHPARQEPLGRVLLESASSGLPIVTTSVGGTPEILEGPQFTQLMIEPNDPAKLTGVLERLLLAPHWAQTLNRIGSRLRQLAIRKFSNAQCAENLHKHYRELTGYSI